MNHLAVALLFMFSSRLAAEPAAQPSAPVKTEAKKKGAGEVVREGEVDKAEAGFVSLDACVKKSRIITKRTCWMLIEQGFIHIFPLHLREIDGARTGHFFPNTQTFTRQHVDSQHHFLQVFCLDQDGSRSSCPEQGNILEKRVVEISLVEALPVKKPPTSELYDQNSWQLTPAARNLLQDAQRVFPDLWTKVVDLVEKTIGGPNVLRSNH